MLVLGSYGAHETFFRLKGGWRPSSRPLNLPKAEYEAEANHPAFHPGRCAKVSMGGKVPGLSGSDSPAGGPRITASTARFTAPNWT